MRDSFIFYRSFFETIKKIPKKDRLQLVEAICNYALNDEEDSLSSLNAAIFEMVKPQIDANTKRYENGKKGGRPKKPNQNQNETKTKPKQNQTITKTKPNVNVNVNVNDNVNDNVNVNESGFDSEPSETSPSVIIKYLNFKTGADYDPDDPDNIQYVTDLFDAGYSNNDLMKVVNKKCSEWMNDSVMRSYLRPSTLFGSKFPEYLAQPESVQAETERKKTDELKDVKEQLSSKRKQLKQVRTDMEDPELVEDSLVNVSSRFYDLRDQEAILEETISRLEAKVSALGG